MVLVPKAHGEGKRRPLPSPKPQKHTVKASGRCLHHGFGAEKHTVKASGRCLHRGFGAWFWCQKHRVKARAGGLGLLRLEGLLERREG